MRPVATWAPRNRQVTEYRAKLQDRVPKHVAHCFAGGARDWWIYTWKKRTQTALTAAVPVQSWRCKVCRKHESHVTYARAQEGCEGLTANGFLMVVLTLDRAQFEAQGKAAWENVDAAYKALSAMSRAWMKRLKRWQVKQGMVVWDEHRKKVVPEFGSKWFSTVESHKSGWPMLTL